MEAKPILEHQRQGYSPLEQFLLVLQKPSLFETWLEVSRNNEETRVTWENTIECLSKGYTSYHTQSVYQKAVEHIHALEKKREEEERPFDSVAYFLIAALDFCNKEGKKCITDTLKSVADIPVILGLIDGFKKERDWEFQKEKFEILSSVVMAVNDPAALTLFSRLVDNTKPYFVTETIGVLEKIVAKDKRTLPLLLPDFISALQNKDNFVRTKATFVLGNIAETTRQIVPLVVTRLQDEDVLVRNKAVQALKSIKNKGIVSYRDILKDVFKQNPDMIREAQKLVKHPDSGAGVDYRFNALIEKAASREREYSLA